MVATSNYAKVLINTLPLAIRYNNTTKNTNLHTQLVEMKNYIDPLLPGNVFIQVLLCACSSIWIDV